MLSLHNTISEYLRTASEQIRWKRARKTLQDELEAHLADQKNAYMSDGMDEKAAEAEAINQMGDPVTVGQELDRVHKPKPQWKLLLFVSLIAVCGAFLRSDIAPASYSDIYQTLVVMSLVVGLPLMFLCYFIDYTFFARHAQVIYFVLIAVNIVSFFLDRTIYGKRYYLQYITYMYPMIYSMTLYSLRGKGVKGLILSILAAIFLAVSIMLVPTLSSLIVFIISALIMLVTAIQKGFFVEHKRLSISLIIGLTAVLCGIFIVAHYDSIYQRVLFCFHPEYDSNGYGYQATVIKNVLSVSKLCGHGAAYDELIIPQWYSDFLLTNFIYKYGWMPFIAVCCVLSGFLIWAAAKCIRQKNVLGYLVSLSIVLTFGIQIIMNVTYNLGFCLFSIPCPFIVGNTNAIIDMLLAGILLSTFRNENLPVYITVNPSTTTQAKHNFIRWDDGNLIISFNRQGKI